MNEKKKMSFGNLGKATLRGVRRCPKCGTYNGTRGMCCKNKECKLVFKVTGEKKSECEVNAARLIINASYQVYSIKDQTNQAGHRCFVHIPVIDGLETLKDSNEIICILQSTARCYATQCVKPLESVLTLNLTPCSHTFHVVNCVTEAKPLPLKNSILNVLPISDEIKSEILSLAEQPDDCLVHRVSKNSLAVKCKIDEKHPIGFLHFSIYEPFKNSKKFRILCECQTEITKPFVPKEKQMCVHFYTCVCAFASSPDLLEEFSLLIESVLTPNNALNQPNTSQKNCKSEVKLEECAQLDENCPTTKRAKNDPGC